MRVIKCDICKKEISSELVKEDFFQGRKMDFCPNCHIQFRNVKNDLIKQEEQLQIEYENKRQKLYETLVTKFDLNKK